MSSSITSPPASVPTVTVTETFIQTISETLASAAASTSESGEEAPVLKAPQNLKVVGVILAVVSGLLIGASFVFKKKGLLRAQAGGPAGEGVGYLKSPLWWLGMIMMILGEVCNFAAYAFVEALVVTPLGALSVVVCAILSSLFLDEKLSFFGWLGCGLCILGSVIIALNGPKEETLGQIRDFQKLFLAPGFLAYTGVLIAISLGIVFYFAPRYGKKSMMWYIFVCSMIGGLSVSVTTGLGSAIVTTAMGDNQFKYWFMYFLMGFVVITLLTEVYYLNVALALFNTAMVTPTYYVIFTFFSMLTTIVLFQGLKATVTQIITIVMAFLVICLGITILQMSKVDPAQLKKLDRRSTMLLQAARSQTDTVDEKGIQGVEDPGMDALRGSFGAVGSIIRARSARRMSQSSRAGTLRNRYGSDASAVAGLPYDPHVMHPYGAYNTHHSTLSQGGNEPLGGMQRHQLYDAPMPMPVPPPGLTVGPSASDDTISLNKRPTIKFDETDVVHRYGRPGTGDSQAIHEHRPTLSPSLRPQHLSEISGHSYNGNSNTGYPPTPSGGTVPTLPPPPASPAAARRRQQDEMSTPEIRINLLELTDEPALPTGLSMSVGGEEKGFEAMRQGKQGQGQYVLPPLSMLGNPEIRSAPPTVNQRFLPGFSPGSGSASGSEKTVSPTSPSAAFQGGANPRQASARSDSRNIFTNSTAATTGSTPSFHSFPSIPDSLGGLTNLEEPSGNRDGKSHVMALAERERARAESNGSTRAVIGITPPLKAFTGPSAYAGASASVPPAPGSAGFTSRWMDDRASRGADGELFKPPLAPAKQEEKQGRSSFDSLASSFRASGGHGGKKRYPKAKGGALEDDQDESVSLWQKDGEGGGEGGRAAGVGTGAAPGEGEGSEISPTGSLSASMSMDGSVDWSSMPHGGIRLVQPLSPDAGAAYVGGGSTAASTIGHASGSGGGSVLGHGSGTGRQGKGAPGRY